MTRTSDAPLIAHIIYRLDVGGLENGVVNLINRIGAEKYRHVVISLTDATEFRHRINDPAVEIFCLHKKPGQDFGLYARLYKLLRKIRPHIVHTRNLATLECVVPAWLARISCRVHGEHGWDTSDLHGKNRKYRLLRKGLSVFVHQYIALSTHIRHYLVSSVGIPGKKVAQVYNGVDREKFSGTSPQRNDIPDMPDGFPGDDVVVIGTVGRMEVVKDQRNLALAFVELLKLCPDEAHRLRLLMVGDGSMRSEVESVLRDADCMSRVWLPGNRQDVSSLMQAMDVFALPSRNEGISNTILEAMSTGLPVVATNVGGNAELVVDGETGFLVPAEDPMAMAEALRNYVLGADTRTVHGKAGRARIESHFSLDRMVEDYLEIYDACLRSC